LATQLARRDMEIPYMRQVENIWRSANCE